MLSKTILASALLFASHFTSGCPPPDNSTTLPTLGPDCPSDPATTGYMTNHFSLVVSNLTATLDFYTKVFGFRRLFTLQIAPTYSITYIAHAQGGKNGTGYQTVNEMIREKNNRQGNIELHFWNDTAAIANLRSSTKVPNATFSHIGIIVPDMDATLKRLQDMNVEIISKPGDPLPTYGSPLLNAVGAGTLTADHPDAEALVKAFGMLAGGLIFCTDPDGNMVEIQPLVETAQF